jgi:hypothetical protein
MILVYIFLIIKRGINMKKVVTWFGMGIALIFVVLQVACDNTGGGSGTLTVTMTGYPEGTEGHMIQLGLFIDGDDPFIEDNIASGDFELGFEDSTIMDDASMDDVAEIDIVLDPGDYDLYAFIDVNDNIDIEGYPEESIDMTYTTFPIDVTVDGNTTVTLLPTNFELFTGFE